MKNDAARIMFVHNGPQRFVTIDRELLAKRYTVSEFFVRSKRINALKTFNAVWHSDIVFCWFASWFSFLPVMLAKALRKPIVLVTGGYDTANVPEAGYGLQTGRIQKIISRLVIRNADYLIVNSQFARAEVIANVGPNPSKINVIYHGLECPEIDVSGPRERMAITVGGVRGENLLRKGLLPFVEAARYLPNIRFVQIGKWYDDSVEKLRAAAGPNVEIAGFASDDALNQYYSNASVYVQPSLHEAFGMSLAEAMLRGCIPVVTRIGAIPEVVGNAGIYCESQQPKDIADAIGEALAMGDSARQTAHDQILTKFPMEKRRQAFYGLIDSILK